MSAYGALAAWYDALTRDVDYAAFADFYEQCFQQGRGESHTLLDFCCGTGTLTRLMAARGYEMIATDGSPDMLMQAQAHNADLPPDAVAPLLLCQEASELDLYGTVDAAYCSLDGIDYLPPEELPEVLHRLHLFVRPGGMLILDIRDPASFRALDGGTFVDETDDVLCLWRSLTRRRRPCTTAWICLRARASSGRVRLRSTLSMRIRPSCSRGCSQRRAFSM